MCRLPENMIDRIPELTFLTAWCPRLNRQSSAHIHLRRMWAREGICTVLSARGVMALPSISKKAHTNVWVTYHDRPIHRKIRSLLYQLHGFSLQQFGLNHRIESTFLKPCGLSRALLRQDILAVNLGHSFLRISAPESVHTTTVRNIPATTTVDWLS